MNIQDEHRISYGLPLLKKDAFENALYTLVELGVHDIYPLITDKIHRNWIGKKSIKDNVRLKKIMISAAEQSKNYAYPICHELHTLDQFLHATDTYQPKIFFDACGDHIMNTSMGTSLPRSSSIALLIGPEGDLSSYEKQRVSTHKFESCMLTRTILRAQQAAVVSTGVVKVLCR
jgi:16S rRNA (uracil1498-N3)-methyltransferase